MSKIRVVDIYLRTGDIVSIRGVENIVSHNGLVSFIYPDEGKTHETSYPVDRIRVIENYEDEE